MYYAETVQRLREKERETVEEVERSYAVLRVAAFPNHTCRDHCTALNGILHLIQDEFLSGGITEEEAIAQARGMATSQCTGPDEGPIIEISGALLFKCNAPETRI